jgi:hypothetical protein
MLDMMVELDWVSVTVSLGLVLLLFCLSSTARFLFVVALAMVNVAAWLWGDAGLLFGAVTGAALLSSLGTAAFSRANEQDVASHQGIAHEQDVVQEHGAAHELDLSIRCETAVVDLCFRPVLIVRNGTRHRQMPECV